MIGTVHTNEDALPCARCSKVHGIVYKSLTSKGEHAAKNTAPAVAAH